MDINETKSQLKIIFSIHFLLITWGLQGYWSPDSYLFYNTIFIVCLLWSMYAKDDPEPLQMAVGINLLAIFLDIVVLAGYFPSSNASGERFSGGMAILNLVVRPLSSYFLAKCCSQRNGLDGDSFPHMFGGATSSSARGPYEDIDNTLPR